MKSNLTFIYKNRETGQIIESIQILAEVRYLNCNF